MALVPVCYNDMYRNCHFSAYLNSVMLTHKKLRPIASSKGLESHLRSTSACNSRNKNLGMILFASDSGTTGKQLSSLDSYFGKLRNGPTSLPQDESTKPREPLRDNNTGQVKLKKGLESLDDYLGKLHKGEESENGTSSSVHLATDYEPISKPPSVNGDSEKGNETILKRFRNPAKDDRGPEISQDSLELNETSDLYLISTLASVNIAVFLFEIASPVRNSDLGLFSLPLLYGAKINDLILVGEWWRLVTPMFLHSGFFHIAVGCWGLMTFGTKVCRGYGSFTFFLIYMLGGVSGNLISFLHTPEPTVGGTGPIFAVIGAWLTYQVQNKDIISKEVSESMFQKAVITTLLSITLSIFGPIDDWTHFGAAFTGVAYGFLTCPTLQLDDASSSSTTRQEEGITLVRRYADPCKSLLFFTLFVLVLSSVLFFIEPPLNVTALGST